MLSNPFRILFRRLWRKRTFSFLNIAGLAVGIAASLLIFLIIRYETNYESYNSKKDRIYRVVTSHFKRSNGELDDHIGFIPFTLPDAMRLDFPALEKVAAVGTIGGAQIHIPGRPGKELEDEKVFKEDDGLFWTEPSFYDMFDYEWLEGNASGLKDPNTAVITESMANTWYGNWRNAVGKTIQMWSFRIPLRVVGVFKDLPANTDMQVRMGASYATFRKLVPEPFTVNNTGAWDYVPWGTVCFVLVQKEQEVRRLESQLPLFVKKYYSEDGEQSLTRTSLHFQPLGKMHLDENFSTYKGDALTHKELWSLGLIGLFLLIVACINFINLATAQSISRAKEIGVRKVLGSNRPQLLRQFLGETGLITFFSLVLACIIAMIAMPGLDKIMNKPLSLNLFSDPLILVFLVIIGLVVTFLAGFYPGMVMSGFNPVAAIKSKISTRTIGGASLRRGLVVIQFIIAQLLVIGTLVVVRQMHFFRNQPMGFEKNAAVLVELPSDSLDRLQYHYLTDRMAKVPGVEAVSMCMDAPASRGSNPNEFYFDNSPRKADFNLSTQYADTGYLNTFRIGLVAGRPAYASDTIRELLVNETAVRRLGFKDPKEILGKTITFGFNRNMKYPIVGVMHDFNSKSLREAIRPLALTPNANAYNYISLRIDPTRIRSTLEQVHTTFTHIYPYYIFDLNFLDQRIEQFYHSEAITSQLFTVFAFLAIFISCLGLYGLVSFMAVQKTKEVGIRKVLGASVQNIVYLFSREFTLLIGIAFVIAAPLGYYLMQGWLSGFYYHIRIGWGVFALAMVLSLVIAWITVGYKAVKAGIANPVKNLRSE